MNAQETQAWNTANQQYLMASLRVISEALQVYKLSPQNSHPDASEPPQTAVAGEVLKKAADDLPAPAAIDTITGIFGLSPFERSILLLCAGVELDSHFASLISSLEGDPARMLPSFSLALSALQGAHWSALSPYGPLRYWRLVELNQGQLITKSPVRIDERILHYLTGLHHLDERLRAILTPVQLQGELVPTQQELANRFLQACAQPQPDSLLPVMQLSGDDPADNSAIAVYTAFKLGFVLYSISFLSLPVHPKDMHELIRLYNREAALEACALYLDCSSLDLSDKQRLQSVISLVELVNGLIIVDAGNLNLSFTRPRIVLDVHKPTLPEQLTLWKNILGAEADNMNGQLDRLASQFNFSAKALHQTGTTLLQQLSMRNEDEPAVDSGRMLWNVCRVNTRPQTEELARRIKPCAGWNDIVLPEAQKQLLRDIAVQVKHRTKVYNDWGFASASARGLGISALFTGESGTGKTMASEVLANDLQLDLYHVDLSQVVNKYIGETEKNLKRIFDAAELGGAILLFDEADALFGKRSDVKDSHDRYANIEVSFLLQRMEAYRGLAILTTNMKSAIDKAFLRRIRFVVQFPFPDMHQRAEIWKRVFPERTPRQDLDTGKLARLNIAGGSIKNIALNAAFIAAEEGEPVRMSHISQAARSEYNKLEKPLSNAELTW